MTGSGLQRGTMRHSSGPIQFCLFNRGHQDDWFIAPKTAGPKARQAAQKALDLDESNADAHVVLAIESQWYEWDWAGAEREFKRAIELSPDNGDARGYYSWFLPIMGRGDEAVAEAKRGLQTDPLSNGLNGNLGSVFVFTHQWTERSSNCVRPSISIRIIGSTIIIWAGRMSKKGDSQRPLLRLDREYRLEE
jgi:tetratricopeptide (TPR) repeat protein